MRVTDLGTILGVWAHPDDEAYLSGGLMAMARDAGARVVCVTATRGELGTPDPRTWPPDQLAVVLSGGDTDVTLTVSEDDLLKLERQAFMSLIRHPATLARIEHMPETGKPLRN